MTRRGGLGRAGDLNHFAWRSPLDLNPCELKILVSDTWRGVPAVAMPKPACSNFFTQGRWLTLSALSWFQKLELSENGLACSVRYMCVRLNFSTQGRRLIYRVIAKIYRSRISYIRIWKRVFDSNQTKLKE